MSEQFTEHLDSRRTEQDGNKKYYDFLIRLNDDEAVARSPFKNALMALGELGMTEVLISHPTHDGQEDIHKWWVDGVKKIPGTEPMVADDLGGELNVGATVTDTGERRLEFSFGAGDYKQFDPKDLNEMIWGYLEAIHTVVSSSWEGRNIPLASHKEA